MRGRGEGAWREDCALRGFKELLLVCCSARAVLCVCACVFLCCRGAVLHHLRREEPCDALRCARARRALERRSPGVARSDSCSTLGVATACFLAPAITDEQEQARCLFFCSSVVHGVILNRLLGCSWLPSRRRPAARGDRRRDAELPRRLMSCSRGCLAGRGAGQQRRR